MMDRDNNCAGKPESNEKEVQGGKQTSVTKKRPFSCFHQDSGCKLSFASDDERKSHSEKCIMGLLRWCKEPSCMIYVDGREESLEDLLDHAISRHECGTVVENAGSMVLPISLTKAFLNAKNKDFNARFLCAYEVKKDGSTFKFYIMALVQYDGSGERLLQLICALFGDKEKMNSYIRLKIGLLDCKKNFIQCNGGWLHPSQKVREGAELYLCAIRSEEDVLNYIKNKWVPSYNVKDIIGECASESVKLSLCFTLDPYRCLIYGLQKSMPMPDFCLTWNELGPENLVKREMLTVDADGEKEEDVDDEGDKGVPAVTGVLYPFLKEGHDLVLSYYDNEKVLHHFLALMGDSQQLQNNDEGGYEEDKGITKQKAVLLVLFPTVPMLYSTGFQIVEKAKLVGIRAATLVSSDAGFIDCLKKYGCDVLMTTPEILLDVFQMNDKGANSVMFANLKYMVVSDVDFILRSNTTKVIRKCYNLIPKSKRKNLTRIVMAPFLSKDEMEDIVSAMLVNRQCNAIVLGPETEFLLRSMNLLRKPVDSLSEKVNEIINIIRSNFLGKSRRLVIVGNEGKVTYKGDFDKMFGELAKNFPEMHLIRCDEESDFRPTSFDAFKEDCDAILLTSYYCTQYDAVKLSDGIIIFDEPPTVAEMLRFVPFTRKSIYVLSNQT